MLRPVVPAPERGIQASPGGIQRIAAATNPILRMPLAQNPETPEIAPVAHLKELSKETFESEALARQGLVLVDFWAPWCAPCRALLPILEELAAHYTGRVTIAKMNVDHDPERAVGMGVRGVPTVVFLHDGLEIDRVVG